MLNFFFYYWFHLSKRVESQHFFLQCFYAIYHDYLSQKLVNLDVTLQKLHLFHDLQYIYVIVINIIYTLSFFQFFQFGICKSFCFKDKSLKFILTLLFRNFWLSISSEHSFLTSPCLRFDSFFFMTAWFSSVDYFLCSIATLLLAIWLPSWANWVFYPIYWLKPRRWL